AAAGGDLVAMALDATRVYYTASVGGMGDVSSVNKMGTGMLVHWTGPGLATCLALSGNTLVFTMPGPGNVMRVDVTSTTAATPVAVNQAGPVRAAANATRACWANQGTAAANFINGSIACATLSDNQVTILAPGQARPGDIAVDDTYAYWTTRNGSVLRIAF